MNLINNKLKKEQKVRLFVDKKMVPIGIILAVVIVVLGLTGCYGVLILLMAVTFCYILLDKRLQKIEKRVAVLKDV